MRRQWLYLAAVTAAVLVGCGSPPGAQNDQAAAPDKAPSLPSKPVTLTVLDVSGDLISSKELIENFAKANPKIVKDVKFLTADAPSLVGKVKAQQQSGHVDIDLVLTGNDGLAAGLKQDMWVKLLPNLQTALPDLDSTLTPVAKEMQPLAQGFGVVNRAGQNGPLLQYDPKQLPQPPKTPKALLDWAKAHPKKFIYARPSNSGPGRTFLMALPYLLGDKDPSDPVKGWDKTWAYLKELGKYVEYYPSGTADTVKMLGQGRVGLIPSITGFDIQGRSDGTLPPNSPIAEFDGQKWVADAHYMVVPRGGDKGRLAATLALMKWMLKPDQQELTYATGNLTPVTEAAKLDGAPANGQAFMKKYGRPDTYPKLFANADVVKPVEPDAMVDAFDKWDREIGSKR